MAQLPRTGIVLVGGLVAGFVGGGLGIGGGVLLVPFLVLVLQRPQHVAHATSLVAVVVVSLAGAVRFGVGDAVAWPAAVALGAGAVVGAQVGAGLVPRVSPRRLRQAFTVLLILVGVQMLVFGDAVSLTSSGAATDASWWLLALHVAAGFGVGVSSSTLGIGGGAVMVPLLALVFGYSQHVAEGTSLAMIVPTALTGAIAHHRRGYTDWRLGGQLGTTAAAGAVAGASVALVLDPTTLSRLFGAVLLILGAVMLRRPARSD